MDELNDMFENSPKLNIKKILIVAGIAIAVIILIVCLIVFNSKESEETISTKNTILNSASFTDKNNDLTITLSKKFDLTQKNSNNNHVLELSSPQNLNISLSKESLDTKKSLKEIIESDKKVFTKSFADVVNISDVIDQKINNITFYTYSFNYTNTEAASQYFIQPVWFEHNGYYYILDITFPQENFDFSAQVIDEIVLNLKFNNQ